MATKEISRPVNPLPARGQIGVLLRKRLSTLPWWALALGLIILMAASQIITRRTYREAFDMIGVGMGITLTTTLIAYGIALLLGLVAGFGRISRDVAVYNAATLYVELIRGIPMLVLIFFIALVGVPAIIDLINAAGGWLQATHLLGGWVFTKVSIRSIPMEARAIAALAITYGAYQAEIVRAGIQSVDRGQMEAARSQGLSYFQAMRYVILPQAIRNVLPALGNEFIAMLKDSSLVSVLAVRDITQLAKLYSGQSFHYQEAYVTLASLYLMMTVGLSLVMKQVERRYGHNGKR